MSVPGSAGKQHPGAVPRLTGPGNSFNDTVVKPAVEGWVRRFALKTTLKTTDTLVAVSFSSDGHRLAGVATDGTVLIRDATPLAEKP